MKWKFWQKSSPAPVTETKSTTQINLDMLSMLQNTDNTARIETVYSCIHDKSSAIGQLPLKLYRVDRDGIASQVKTGREHRILTQKPNDYMTTQELMEMISASIDLNGAFYAYKTRNARGNLMEIIPFRFQSNVRPAMDAQGRVFYTYAKNDGTPCDSYALDDLFIVKSFTTDGYTPISPIQHNDMLLNGTMSQEQNYAALSKDGVTSDFALSTDVEFKTPEAVERLREDLQKMRGAKGTGHTPIFEAGVKPLSLRLNPKDADLINQRLYSVERICRIFGVPLERVGSPKGSTTPDMNMVDEGYMRKTLNPLLCKIEAQFNLMLMNSDLRIKIDRKAFYAGSPWRLAEGVAKEFSMGACDLNEMRADLGRDPVPHGDGLFAIDTNNIVFGKWEDLQKIQQQLYGERQNQSAQEADNAQAE